MSWRCARGTVMVETLIAFMPVFMLFLGIVQYALLAAAELVVRHAAVAGVRSAAVVLDDDPAYYGGAERLSIRDEGDRDSSRGLAGLAGFVLSAAPEAPAVPAGLALSAGRGMGPRLWPIRDAVYAKLAAIVPARALGALQGSPGISVLDALGEAPALRLIQAPLYLPITTSITFPRSPGASELFDDLVDPDGPLTLRVSHLVTCTVPLVSALMCRPLKLRDDDELRGAPAARFQAALSEHGARFKRLQAEASMPLQRARYPYPSTSAGSSSP